MGGPQWETYVLRLDAVEAGYGDVVAVRAVSLEVRAGEIVALIGSNGAGKTTTLRAIAGLLPLRGGRVELDGRALDGLGSAAVVAAGVAHVPEGRQLFPTMTVGENLELGARTRESRARRAETLARVFELFPRLAERRTQLAGTLSGGEQQMVAIGRALMARPRLLMLDEPSLGLAPVVVGAIFANLAVINRDGLTILLVEQNVLRALRCSHRAYVLENGTITLSGPSATLLTDERIKRAYLGR
jgi:branched-chain amino acid transport system ATP-binding protein